MYLRKSQREGKLNEVVFVLLRLNERMKKSIFSISCSSCLFTTINHGLVYLVDSSGVKSTTESFVILNNETTRRYFYSGTNYSPSEEGILLEYSNLIDCKKKLTRC